MSDPPRSIPPSELLDDVRRRLGTASAGSRRLLLGVELELIPARAGSGARIPVTGNGEEGPSGVSLLEDAGRGLGWAPGRTASGSPSFSVRGAGAFSFEPGGQLEFSSLPAPSVDELTSTVRTALRPVYRVAEDRGVRLVARGLDPHAGAGELRLMLPSERYRKQRAHYDRIGPAGRTMMLQSAAVHVNVDSDGPALRRWNVANRMAPFLTALFANSRIYAGAPTGNRSHRAEQWRRIDPSRTGLFGDDADPAEAYLSFALDALDFLGSECGAAASPFRARWKRGASRREWRDHLTTLFPEVRPRGYLEIRSFDALRPAWLPVPLLVAVGTLYDPDALSEAERLLPPADPERLRAAGRRGLTDPELREGATRLFDVALEGAARLGEEAVGGAAIEVARAYRERFLARGEDPGTEPEEVDPFEI